MTDKELKSPGSENKNNNAPVSKKSTKSNSEFVVHCNACDMDLPSESAYLQHVQGKKHVKASARMEIKAGRDSINEFLGGVSDIPKKSKSDETSADETSTDETSKADIEIFCEVCKKSCSGYIPYKQHLISATHHKNVKKEKLMNLMKNRPEVLSNEINSEESDDEAYLPKVYAKCDTCEKEFGGPEAFEQHLRGAQHKKKLQMKKLKDQMKSTVTGESENNQEEEDMFSHCEVCDKTFSGPVPYKIHMTSSIHKKAVQKAHIVSQIKDICIQEDDKFLCKECKKPFTNPKALQVHINSNDHEKQKERAEIKEFLALHPEIMMVKAIDNGEEEHLGVFFMCKICNISLSGPKSAKSHVDSKKHKSMKSHMTVVKQLKQSSKSIKESHGNSDENSDNSEESDGFEVLKTD